MSDLRKALEEGRAFQAQAWEAHVQQASQRPPMRITKTDRDEDGLFLGSEDPEEHAAIVEKRTKARDERKARAEKEAAALAEYEAMSPLERADVPDARRAVLEGMIAKRERGGV